MCDFYLGEMARWAADSGVQKWNLFRASEQTFVQWDLSWVIDDSEIAVQRVFGFGLFKKCVGSCSVAKGGEDNTSAQKWE